MALLTEVGIYHSLEICARLLLECFQANSKNEVTSILGETVLKTKSGNFHGVFHYFHSWRDKGRDWLKFTLLENSKLISLQISYFSDNLDLRKESN